MAITSEEREYFLEGIKRVFPKTTNANLARAFVKDGKNAKSIIKSLEDITDYIGDFVAEASAKGVLTPKSIIDISIVDIANTQKYIGLDNSELIQSQESINLKNMIDEVKKLLGTKDLSDFSDPTITAALVELRKSISDIFQILSIDKGGDGHYHSDDVNDIHLSDSVSYGVSGEPKTLTSCSYSRKTGIYTLDKVITVSSATSLGLHKSYKDCADWDKEDVAHYFTETDNPEDCAVRGYMDQGLANSECVSALGIVIY